ncbi:MFS transporter [Patescibacteria group bacterium]
MSSYPEQINGFSNFSFSPKTRLPGYAGLYLSSAFQSLGMSLIGLFIPLYVLKLTGSVPFVFLFYGFYHCLVVLFSFPVGKLVSRWGIDWIGFLGSIFRVIFIFLLIQAEKNPTFLWLSAFFWGITVAFSWIPFHYAFTIAEKEDGKYGKEVSQQQIIYKITGLVGPVAGGVMIASFGFDSLFSLALILVAVSGFPLFFDTLKAKNMEVSFAKIKSHLLGKKQGNFWLGFVGGEIEAGVLGLAWPLYIFLVVGSYQALGAIKSLATLVSAALVLFLGKWIDKKGKSILYLGTVLNSFNVLLRAFLQNPVGLFFVDSAYGVTSNLVATPFDSAFYERARGMRKLEFMVERELIIHLSGFVVCLLLSLLFAVSVGWFWVFALGIVGILMRSYIIAQEEEPWWKKLRKRFF